jgi:hypothetical protein
VPVVTGLPFTSNHPSYLKLGPRSSRPVIFKFIFYVVTSLFLQEIKTIADNSIADQIFARFILNDFKFKS